MLALFLLLLTAPLASAANSEKNFGGVGIDGLPRADGEIVIRQLVAGGPAAQSGIRIGDIITHIDGKPTRGSDFRKMVDYRLRGRAGTPVALTIHRPGEDRPRKLVLIRRQLVLSPPPSQSSR
jgi:C-terminal processing protease CtpA/Prc